MNPLLEQFLSEAREFLEGIGEKLMQLENTPDDASLINELFRLVHTLKGNSGLFTFPEMTRVLHAGEDLLGMVRNGQVDFSRKMADQLLDAMDFVGLLCDDIQSTERIDASRTADSARLAEALRMLLPAREEMDVPGSGIAAPSKTDAVLSTPKTALDSNLQMLADIPVAERMEAFRQCSNEDLLYWVAYAPESECFFQGDDPFHTARQTPGLQWGRIIPSEPLPSLDELDTYRCILQFHLLSAASHEEIVEHYRYVPDQVHTIAIQPLWIVIPQGDKEGTPIDGEFVSNALRLLEAGDLAAIKQATQTMLMQSGDEQWTTSALRWLLLLLDKMPDDRDALRLLIESLGSLAAPDWTAANAARENALPVDSQSPAANTPSPLSEEDAAALSFVFAAQRQILMLDDHTAWRTGQLKSVAEVLASASNANGNSETRSQIDTALAQAIAQVQGAPLLAWLDVHEKKMSLPRDQVNSSARRYESEPEKKLDADVSKSAAEDNPVKSKDDDGPKFGRRAEDAYNGPKSLKVDQAKIDRLMNLIGEMVVSKNALPYLAQRAEVHYGVRELSREIKAQYAVINRIADEMQDAIMQVRMMAVSFVFQRFPRLVRDISRKLGKEVQLVFEGEETQADKNIIESLADPLMHIVRNSLDHGLETPEVRRAQGKPDMATITMRAAQETDRVLIEIIDDGKGIDPTIIKRKAYEKGLIDEATLERIGDREAVNLIFAAGFSTAEKITDLSGRGVGMDVVRTAVEKINGTVQVDSTIGKGTSIRISLPLSMAVTQVMIIESDGQLFGVPMDHVVETVRIPKSAIRSIKQSQATVLRGRIVPLKPLNALLGLSAKPKVNADDELAVLLVQANGEVLGLLVDGFRETIDMIQKPLSGILSGLTAYSGSALTGDGSVLMVLNIKEII
jgi:two-component system, chemotaxis family, sensor kinase CheA